ncbi:MAG TPA: ABC transporter permease [Acetobacteraceae bacterium]|nr:ABC transporter permease [Acetobacteraceae bacterium]
MKPEPLRAPSGIAAGSPVAIETIDRAPPGLLRRLPSSGVAMFGLGIVLFWVVLALLAPVLPLASPTAQDYVAIAHPSPSWAHLLGVDPLGRDTLSRLIWGARLVLVLAPVAVVVAYAVGCSMGLLAGYYPGFVDGMISRVSDVILAFPVVVLYVVLIAAIGASAMNIVLAVVLASAPAVSRIVRGLTQQLVRQDFVAAARLRRESAVFIMVIEVLPNCRGPLITDFCLRLGYTTITIGTLGFLGLGIPPPAPDWGGMVQQATPMLTVYPEMALFPVAALVSLVLGFNLLADGFNELSRAD